MYKFQYERMTHFHERVDAVYGCKYCAIVGATDWIGASSWVVLVDVGENKGER